MHELRHEADSIHLTLIDFERCGHGSAYDDLSLLCSQLVYTAAALHIPAAPVQSAELAFLHGYRETHRIDSSQLAKTTALRVGLYYMHNFCSERSKPTIAGFPVSQNRVRRLVATLLETDAPTGLLKTRSLGEQSSNNDFPSPQSMSASNWTQLL